MKRLAGSLLIVVGLFAGVFARRALGAPPGPPAGNPIINSLQYQRNSSINIDTGTIRSMAVSTFTNIPSLPSGIMIGGVLYNSAGTATWGAPLFPTPYSYGAIGDGKADDANAMQLFINFAQQFPANTVSVPAGTFRCASPLRVSKSLHIRGLGATVESNDSDYFQKAGAPNDHFGPATIIYFDTANVNCSLFQQNPVGTYKAEAIIENISFVGPGQSSGTAGSGIVVDAGDPDYSFRVILKNVSASNFGGYGIFWKQGYYGSSFDNVSTYFNGLTGFSTTGTNAGEWTGVNLRSFGNGLYGVAQGDRAGLYVESGSRVTLIGVSCTQNYGAQAFFETMAGQLIGFQAESFAGGNSAAQSSLVVKDAHLGVHGAYFAPSSGFLGKIIDVRGVSNYMTMDDLAFFDPISTAAYHVYEDTTTTAGNSYNYYTISGALQANITTDGRIGRGAEIRYDQALPQNQKLNSVVLDIFDSSGPTHVLRHKWFAADGVTVSEASNFNTGLSSATNTSVDTSTATDSSTGFLNSGKISSSDKSIFIMDTADLASYLTNQFYSATLVFNTSGTPLITQVQARSRNVNGITRTRLELHFYNALTGVPYDLTTIALGQQIETLLNVWIPEYQ